MVSDEQRFLERSLADLELERAAGDLSDTDYADLKARYQAKLAGGSTPDQNGRGRRWGRTVAVVVTVVGAGIGLGLLVSRSSGSREPGETITGSAPSTSSEQLAKAAQLFGDGDVPGAIAVYQQVLDENPEDVDALTYFGWLLRNVGVEQGEERLRTSGVALIEKATKIDPTFSQAWFFRGIIYLRDESEPDRAVDALKLALANDPVPELAAAARELLAEIARITTTTAP